jgi:chromosome partitioning protein
MRTIMLLNAKGGSGKSTLATNIAAHYATQGKSVVLADFDPQGSSLQWLKVRPDNRPAIKGAAVWRDTPHIANGTDYVIMDVASGHHGKQLQTLIRYAQTIVVPVLPSPIDIRAATIFIQELRHAGEVAQRYIQDPPLADFFKRIFGGGRRLKPKLGVIANRVRENTVAYDALYDFLDRLKVPFLTSLRDTQNYIQAAERGLGLCELAPSQVAYDMELWEPLIKWLNSKRSSPPSPR